MTTPLPALELFLDRLGRAERSTFLGFRSPHAVQVYLDGMPYVAEERDRSPLAVMADRQCHCLDGGCFAALALRRLGFPSQVIDLVPEPGTDDDHVLAVFRLDGLWGALAKSNYPNLRSREPVHRSLRELVMTYFEFYFSVHREKSLRGYTRPMNLSRFKDPSWMWDETALAGMTKRFYSRKAVPLLAPGAAKRLLPADERSFQAASMGTDFNWVYGHRPDQPH